MKTFISFCCLIFTLAAYSQKQLDSIKYFSAFQGEFSKDFIRLHFINSPDSVLEYVDQYISNVKVYNKLNLNIGKYDATCKHKLSSNTTHQFDQLSQKYNPTYRYDSKYDQNCNLYQYITFDLMKMDTIFLVQYDQLDDKGNYGFEYYYNDFDGNGLKKFTENQNSYKYNSQNQLIESTVKENINGKFFTTTKRLFEYNNEGKIIKNQYISIDTFGIEQVSIESAISYFNTGSATLSTYTDYTTNEQFTSRIDTALIDKDDDQTYWHFITKNSTGEEIENVKFYYYYSGSSATTATYIDPDIAIKDFISVEGAMFFTVDNPKGKNMDIQVSDINGRLIYKNTSNESTWHSPQISTNAGMYIFKVETKDGVKAQKKIAN